MQFYYVLDIVFQVILLGDSGVGKTSFIVKYHTNEFKTASFSATVGIALTVSAYAFNIIGTGGTRCIRITVNIHKQY